MRGTIAVILGYVVWTVIWLGGGAGIQGAMPDAVADDGSVVARGALLAFLGLSIVCSLTAGLSTAKLGRSSTGRLVMILAILLLATGIGVQSTMWNKMPVWYHLTFLVLLVPVCAVGGRLAGGHRR